MCNHTFKPLAAGFHSHAHQSLDGGSTEFDKVEYAQSIGRTADCLTDHGIMSGLTNHWNAAKKLSKKGTTIQSIHGIEAYMIDEDRPWVPIKKGSKILIPQYYHLTIHFKTLEAYQYFCKLTPAMESRALIKFGERKPLLKFEELLPMSGQITIGSGCLLGPVQKNVLVGNYGLAEDMYNFLRRVAGPENFYVEVFPHIIDHNWRRPNVDKVTKRIITPGEYEPILRPRDWEGEDGSIPDVDPCTGRLDIQKKPNQFAIEMARKYNDRVIISLDDHYGDPKDRLTQELRLGNGQEAWKFFGTYHAKTSEECADLLKEQLDVDNKTLDSWIDNSYHFVDHFSSYQFKTPFDENKKLIKENVLLPNVEMVYGKKEAEKSTIQIFWEKVEKHGLMPAKDDPKYTVYKERVDYELGVLTNNASGLDFLPYGFLLEDLCDFARGKDITYTSRGSAGGSLALYLLRIVITDPIKYGLSFERFLNPGRIAGGSLPDVDLDWENRHLILEYAIQKYGDKFALISSDGKLLLKNSIKDAERAINGFVSEETERLTKSIKIPLSVRDQKKWLFKGHDGEPPFWEQKDEVAVALRSYAEGNPEIWSTVMRCIGITRQKGIHAGGVVITPGPVQNYMPLIKVSGKNKAAELNENVLATAYDMHGVEGVGGVKFDLLGITTLDALGEALRSIKKHLGISLEWKEFPEDEVVYESVIKAMLLEGIFQLNTNVAAPFVAKIKPKNINEAAALTALCRPGALDADSPDPADAKRGITAAQYYVKCATGERKPYYIHDDLIPILEETHGVIVYQEQAMRIGAEFAGYGEGEADQIIRKGIGKKDAAKIQMFSDDLMKTLPARGWSEEQVKALVNAIQASANYSFNKSHSVSYAIVAWNCAYLKHYYPAHYWKGMLTAFLDKEDKISGFLDECGDSIRPVDIFKSHFHDWNIEDETLLRTPLSMIKGAGGKGAKALYDFMRDYIVETDIKWPEFLIKLKQGKKEGATKGIMMACNACLIFAGAFDSMIEEKAEFGEQHSQYLKMFEEMRDALGSKAMIPKPPKNKPIGLSNIKNDIALGVWRLTVNPLSKFNFLDSDMVYESLRIRGFERNDRTPEKNYDFPFKVEPDNSERYGGQVKVSIVRNWNRVFSDEYKILLDFAKQGGVKMGVLGVVTRCVKLSWQAKDGTMKERLQLDFFNGTGMIKNVTLWASFKSDGKITREKELSLQAGSTGVLILKPSSFNNKNTGTVVQWDPIVF